MERSYNGWRASPNPATLGVKTFEVAGRRFTTVKVAAPLFAYLIRRFDAEVDPLLGGVLDEWSYAYREIRGGGPLSCHASATAVDLDATQFPMGRANMTDKQRARTRSIVKSCHKQLTWGGEFSMPRTDEMHFELSRGTNAKTVEDAIAKMALHDDGRVLHPEDLSVGANPRRIRLLKQALARLDLYPKRPRYNGTWNARLNLAWTLYRTRKPRESAQKRLDALGAQTGLF